MRCICVSNLQIISNPEIVKDLSSIIKPGMKVVCIPYASEPEWVFTENNPDLAVDGSFTQYHYIPFYHYGIDKGDFYVAQASDSIKFIEWKLEQADIIYFSGGRMENLLELLDASGLRDVILDKLDSKILLGESAGAIIMGDYYYEYPYEDEYVEVNIRTGLGLIPNMRLIAHYDEDKIDMDPIVNMQLMECVLGGQPVIVALTDLDVLYTDDTDEYKIIGVG